MALTQQSRFVLNDGTRNCVSPMRFFGCHFRLSFVCVVAQARNLAVMLEALAQGANPNWTNDDDEGKTPLIKATESVSDVTSGPSLPVQTHSEKVDLQR